MTRKKCLAAKAVKQEPEEKCEWQSPVPEIEVGGVGRSSGEAPLVRARKDLPRGARFGPFLGKWAGEPFDQRYAWEVGPLNNCSLPPESADADSPGFFSSRPRLIGQILGQPGQVIDMIAGAHVALTKCKWRASISARQKAGGANCRPAITEQIKAEHYPFARRSINAMCEIFRVSSFLLCSPRRG